MMIRVEDKIGRCISYENIDELQVGNLLNIRTSDEYAVIEIKIKNDETTVVVERPDNE